MSMSRMSPGEGLNFRVLLNVVFVNFDANTGEHLVHLLSTRKLSNVEGQIVLVRGIERDFIDFSRALNTS